MEETQQGEGETTSTTSSSAWDVPDAETLQEKVQVLEKKVQEEEELKKDCQRKVEEEMARKKEAKEEAAMWQVAEVENVIRRLQERADAEENLRKYWQQQAQNEGGSQIQEDKAVLRVKAEAEVKEWKTTAKREEIARRSAERELQKWMEIADGERLVRHQLERQAEVEEGLRGMGMRRTGCPEKDDTFCSRIVGGSVFKRSVICLFISILSLLAVQTLLLAFRAEKDKEDDQWTQLQHYKDQVIAHEYICEVFGDCWVTYRFANFEAARAAGRVLWSPQLCFGDMVNPELRYFFKVKVYAYDGTYFFPLGDIGMDWVLLPGPNPESLQWPFPTEKVRVHGRILGNASRVHSGQFADAAYMATHAPPSKDNSQGIGWSDWVSPGEYGDGKRWLTGPDSDHLVVQFKLQVLAG